MKYLRLAIAALVLLMAAVIPLNTAQAACIPIGRPDIYGNYFDGWFRNASAITGVQAMINSYSPYVYGNSTVAWVMLAARVGPGSTDDRAQVGWLQHPNGLRSTFVQYTWHESGTGKLRWTTREQWAPQTIGLWASYEVLFNTGTGYIEFWYQGQIIFMAHADFFPQSAQASGEVLNQKSQMPGDVNTPEWFTNNYYQPYGGAWTAMDANDGGQSTTFPSWYDFYPPGATSLSIHDKACQY